MSKKAIRRTDKTIRPSTDHRGAAALCAALFIALCFGQGDGARAQHPSIVPALGTIEPTTVEQVDQTEFVLDAPTDRVKAIATRYGLTILREIDAHGHGVYLVRGPSTGSTDDLVNQIAADAEVTHFEINTLAVPPEVPSGITLNQSPIEILDALSDRSLTNFFGQQAWSRYASQPAAATIRLSAAHAMATGAGIVAIIDTGIDPTHPLLSGSLVAGYDFVNDMSGASEWTDLHPTTAAILDQSPIEILDSAQVVSVNQSTALILNPSTATALDGTTLPPAFGHGTMVAGLVHLVAPTAKIMPLKVFRADGSSRVFDIVRAIYYAVEHGARVINMSFSTAALSPEVTHAINYATTRGVVCVSSAGNSGRELLVYPAALRTVIGIGSTNAGSTPVRSSFTNYGDSLVRLGAPGEGVITTFPGGHYAGAWGTSFSTAIVSGAAALLVQKEPALDSQLAFDYLGKAEKMQHLGMGRGRLNLYDAVRQLPDQTAPTVTFTTPSGGATVGRTIAVSVTATDNLSVAGVRFRLNGAPLGTEDTAAPFEVMWNTTTVPNGSHMLTAIARDAAGNEATAALNVVVSNDAGAPTVSISTPAGGVSLGGAVTIAAAASDDVGVTGVQFMLDGAPLGALDAQAPYELTWVTTSASNGAHTITAVARDAAGNQATSAGVSVTVFNDAAAPTVSVTSPAAGASLTGTVALTASAADDGTVASVQFLVDGVALGTADTVAPYEVSWSTLTAANGAHTITAVARDAAGNVATSASVSVTVANDTTPPAVSLTGPANGATVSGTVTLTAAATDDTAVATVQFFVNGVAVGSDGEGPYEAAWSTGGLANGEYTITAVARDAAGNATTSAAAIVTVAN